MAATLGHQTYLVQNRKSQRKPKNCTSKLTQNTEQNIQTQLDNIYMSRVRLNPEGSAEICCQHSERLKTRLHHMQCQPEVKNKNKIN